MNRFCAIAAACLLGIAAAGAAPPVALDPARQVGFDQKLGAILPLDLRFLSDEGKPVALRDYFGTKPVVLVLAYYTCPSLCTLVLNGMTDALRQMRPSAGADFEVVVVSIDPQENAVLAKVKKLSYLENYARPGTEAGWHFLTGDTPSIATLAQAVGFRYAYDPVSHQFAHPSGIVIASPRGRVTQYFFGIEFAAQPVADALRAAGRETVAPPVEQLLLLCFHYNPLTGKYGPLIFNLLRGAGCASVLALAGGIWWMARAPRRKE